LSSSSAEAYNRAAIAARHKVGVLASVDGHREPARNQVNVTFSTPWKEEGVVIEMIRMLGNEVAV